MSSKIYNILRQYHICIKFDNAKCCKLLTSSVFVVWLVNNIVELEVFFCCYNVFHWKGPIGPNMSSKIYILRQYHICIKFDNQRKML